jgi:hypothetical protein
MRPGADTPETRNRRFRRTMSVRLGTLGAVGAAVLVMQAGVATVANATTRVPSGASGTTEAQAKENFNTGSQTTCADHGGVESSTILGVTQQGENDYYAEGYIICKQ